MDRVVALGTSVVLGVWLGPWVPDWAWAWFVGGVAVAPALLLIRSPWPAAYLGLMIGFLAVHLPDAGPAVRGPMALHGVVVGAPSGNKADVYAWRRRETGGTWGPGGRFRLRFPGPAPAPGTEVLAWGMAGRPTWRTLPGGPDFYYGSIAAGLRTEVDLREVQYVGREPEVPLPAGTRHQGVLRALALGDRRFMDPEVDRLMRATGTSHLLSISGSHVGFVALVFGGAVAVLLRTAALFSPRGAPIWPAWWAGAAAAVAYTWVAGAPVSAQRSALLVVLAAVVRGFGASPKPLQTLCALAALLVVFDPANAWAPSFHLSFGAVLGLVCLTEPMRNFLPDRGPLRFLATPLASSGAATVGALPAASWWFQATAPWSLLANLMAIPWTSFVLTPLAGVATFAPDPLARWAAWLGDPAMDALIYVIRPFDAPPIPLALGAGAALAGTLALMVRRRWVTWIALGISVSPGVPPPRAPLRVTFPDVGQGACALVEWPDGRRWLVDGGPPSDLVLQWLRRRGVRRLDVVAASHGQTDHTGGLEAVIRHLEVGELWVPLGSRADPQMHPVVDAALDRGVRVVPGPTEDVAGLARSWLRSENDRSLVLQVPVDGGALLLPGDVERAGEAALVPELRGDIVVVALPHHGSRTSSSPDWVRVVRAPIAVAQVGRPSRFGHPHPEVVDRWAEQGTRLWRTDLDGTVEFTFFGETVGVRTWSPQRGWVEEPPVDVGRLPWLAAGYGAFVSSEGAASAP